MSLQNGIIEEGETYKVKVVSWRMENISTVINHGTWPLVSPSFSFGDSSWHLELRPGNSYDPEFTCLCLCKEKYGEYPMEFIYGMRKNDGTTKILGCGVFERSEQKFGKTCLVMELSKLKQGMSELVPSDVLFLSCLLSAGNSRFSLTSGLHMPKFKKNRADFSSQEAERYGKIVENEIRKSKIIEWKISNISSATSKPECWNSMYSPRFSFENNSWYFELRRRVEGSSESMGMWLNRESTMEYNVEYTYTVKRMDGGLEDLGRGVFQEGTRVYTCFDNKLSVLKQRMSKLAPSDVLTVICRLLSYQPNVLNGPDFKKLKQTSVISLSQNFKDLFADKESSDITLRVKNKEFKAHRSVLMARSSVFYAMFRHDMSERETGIVTIPDCDPDSFQEFLEYLYCGQFEDISFSSAFHMYSTSDKYDVQDLKAICVEYLKQSLTVENLFEVVIMADMHDDTRLFSTAQDFFNRNIEKVFDTAGWKRLMQDNFPLGNKLLKGMSSKVKLKD